MLLTPKEQLVEMVRILEERHHVFKNDPVPITQSLKASNQSLIEKLVSRAARIDAGQELADTIKKVDGRLKFTLFAIGVIWCILGFLGLFALMQTQAVNFFYVLVCLLGMNTLMLVLWFLSLFKKGSLSSIIFNPSFLIRKAEPVTQAAVKLYSEQLEHKGMRWYLGKISHQLWLATLVGMFFAILFLLVVRQYSFNWQSTLLEPQTLVGMVELLGWLPEKLNFLVPTAADVLQSQTLTQASPISADDSNLLAKKWAGLLIGSVLCYGFIPRIIAWLFCAAMFATQKLSLPLKLPYYQNLISQWTTEVVDEDDMPEEAVVKAPEAKLVTSTSITKLACLLEHPWSDSNWHMGLMDTDWQDYGLIDTRDDIEKLQSHLAEHETQLLIGIRAEALPDRGMLRKLDKLAKHAKGGIIVSLLGDSDSDRSRQWHNALAERNIGLVSTTNT